MTPFQDTMLSIAEVFLIAAIVCMILGLIIALVTLSAGRKSATKKVVATRKKVTVPASSDDDFLVYDPNESTGVTEGVMPALATEVNEKEADEVQTEVDTPQAKPARQSTNVGAFSTGFTIIAFVLLTAYLGVRMWLTGYGPFSNQHEFAVSFSWGILAAYLVALWRFKTRMLSLVVLPVATCMTFYAYQLGTEIDSLLPALQNNLLLTIHVGFAVLSYGAACVSFGAAVIYLLYPRLKLKTPRESFDEMGYKAAVVTFPLLTIMILVGALWASTAWGRYWGWDPKETAALVTWLIYGAFLHARVARGWKGTKSATLLVIGFAAVLFAFFGNHFFGGLHSYG